MTTEDSSEVLAVLRTALESSDAWDFSEVDDGLDADILAALSSQGYTIFQSAELERLRAVEAAALRSALGSVSGSTE